MAGGLGERLALDPFFVRVGLVAATILLAARGDPPVTAVAYAAAWLVIPETGRRPVLARLRGDADARREAAVALLLLAATVVLVPRLGPAGETSLLLGVAMLGLAMLLLSRARNGPSGSPGAVDAATSSPPETQPETSPEPTPRQPRPARREPALWPLALSALLLFGVLCVIADQVLDPGLDPGLAVSGALLIVAAVLITSTWRGRGRSTIALGVALLPLWAAFTLTDVDRYPGIGDIAHRPTTRAAAETGFELGYGRIIVDLRAVPLEPGGELRTSLGLTGGTARVRLPADTRLVLTGDIGLGTIAVNRLSRWDAEEEAVINQRLRRRYDPVPSTCALQPVPSTGLTFADDHFPTIEALDAELRRRGWPVTSPTDPPWPEGPHAAQPDDPHMQWVLVGVDEQWQLCDHTAPPMPDNPATIVLDVRVGLGTLEITRERST